MATNRLLNLRPFVKRVIERGIVVSGAARMIRRRHRHDVLILAYHNIVPHGEPVAGDTSLHLSQRNFAEQLDLLRETHDVVPLNDVIGTSFANTGRPRAVVTFDDAYYGTMTAGIAELQQRGLAATVFVPPAYVGGNTFWWDTLTAPGSAAPDAELRELALRLDAGQETRITKRATQRGIVQTAVPRHATCATQDDLEQALRYPALTFGSHSWSHPNLAALAPDALTAELTRSLEWLQQFGERMIPAISYPYGCANADVWRAAETVGYRAGFMIDGGWVTTASHASPYTYPRLNIPAGVSTDGFAMRLAGLVAA